MPHVGGSLINSIKVHLGLPQYHVEMPQYHVELPFLEVLPSIDNALSSIKVEAGKTEDNRVVAYTTITHSLDDLNNEFADLSKPFGGLLGQMMVAGNAGILAIPPFRILAMPYYQLLSSSVASLQA